MPNNTSGGYTGPYPELAAAETHSEVAPIPTGGPDDPAGGSTAVGPTVATDTHSEVAPIGTGGADDAAAGSTAVGPTVASEAHSEVAPATELATDGTTADGSTTLPSVDVTPGVDALPEIEDAAIDSGSTSDANEGTLPTVAAGEAHSEVEPVGPSGGHGTS
jgi:hypothetical protein